MNVFKGSLIHKIECLNSNFQSSSIENFYDIQLPIKNCKNIMESLKEYTKKAFLVGDNQYDTGKGKEVRNSIGNFLIKKIKRMHQNIVYLKHYHLY